MFYEGSAKAEWWAQLVGALRVHPHKRYANYPLQKDRGFARGARVEADFKLRITAMDVGAPFDGDDTRCAWV
jgi:hypothetical protein